MSKGVSVVIAYHNDVADLMETLDSLYDTMNIDPWEVIVVNDGGRNKLKEKRRNLIHIDNPINLGVGRSFDIGVGVAQYDTIFISCADITHPNSDYVEKMYSSVQDNPKSLICTTTCSYQNPHIRNYGADILFKITDDDLPKNSPFRKNGEHRSILEGRWRTKTGEGTYPIPSLMGSFYGVTREWYEFVRGFELHYQWGSLEPYISLKSWMLGGSILINTDIDVLHKSGRVGFAKKEEKAYVYNRMMIAFVVFGSYGIQFAEHLGQNSVVAEAADIYHNAMQDVSLLRAYIEEHSVMSPEELHKKMVSMSQYHGKKGLTE